MKILLSVILLSVFFLVINIDTDAGFHGTGLICNKCHTMHYSEDGGIPPGADAGGPFAALLIKQYSTELCLTCHDNTTDIPDVFEGDGAGGPGDNRAAGFFAVGVGDGNENSNGHNLAEHKVTSDTSCSPCHWDLLGEDFNTLKIGCLDCHDAHGWDSGSANHSYRNLDASSHSLGSPRIEVLVNPTATGLDVYDKDNVGYPVRTTWLGPGSNQREVNNVCYHCHYPFSEDARNPGDGVCILHPNTESYLGVLEFISQADGAHWADGTGPGFGINRLPYLVLDPTDYSDSRIIDPNRNAVFCLTCHKPHGSAYNSALHWDYRNNSNEGCQQCHNKGN